MTQHSLFLQQQQQQNIFCSILLNKKLNFCSKNVIQPQPQPQPQPPIVNRRLTIHVQNSSTSSRTVVETSSQPLSQTGSTPTNQNRPKPNPPAYLMRPASATCYDLLTKQMTYLFNRPCFRYLKEGSHDDEECIFNHFLPRTNLVYRKLMLFSDETILGMYTHFIVKNQISFDTFFRTICRVFSEKRMKSALLTAVAHCDGRRKSEFYLYIYDALVAMGELRIDALNSIIEHSCRDRVACTNILHIAAKDPMYFIVTLKRFYLRADIQTQHLLKMLQQIVDNPAPSLLTLFIDMLDKYSMSDACEPMQYKQIYHNIIRFLVGDNALQQRLNYITKRNKRINFVKINI